MLLLSEGNSGVSSCRLLEKKVLLDAVIGVVGVFGICRDGGGLKFRSTLLCSCNAAILFAVGVLRGPRLIGGRRNGCKCLLFCGVPFFSTFVFMFDA